MTSTSPVPAAGEPLERYVEALRTQWLLPGCAVAVTGAETTLLALHLGHADLDTRSPVGPATAFEIGSISKSMTSLALLGLAEEGALAPRRRGHAPPALVRGRLPARRDHRFAAC